MFVSVKLNLGKHEKMRKQSELVGAFTNISVAYTQQNKHNDYNKIAYPHTPLLSALPFT